MVDSRVMSKATNQLNTSMGKQYESQLYHDVYVVIKKKHPAF